MISAHVWIRSVERIIGCLQSSKRKSVLANDRSNLSRLSVLCRSVASQFKVSCMLEPLRRYQDRIPSTLSPSDSGVLNNTGDWTANEFDCLRAQ